MKSLPKTPKYAMSKTLGAALKRRPTENAVTIEDLMDMWERQRGRCAVSGIQLTYEKGELLPTTISLDRIDSSLGYARGNVRLICLQANYFKNKWDDAQMIFVASNIVASAKTPMGEPQWTSFQEAAWVESLHMETQLACR